MQFANLLVLIGIGAEATLIVVLAWRRIYRSFPVFFFYIVWGVAGDATILILRTLAHSRALYPFEIQSYIDSAFQYMVLVELAWSVLRPIRRSLPGGFLLAIPLAIAAGAVLAWPLSGIHETLGIPRHYLLVLHAQRAFTLLRILFFVVLACCSHIVQIGWRDRELQIASGLGFYSLVSLAGTLVHSHQTFGWHYFFVDVAVAFSYLLSLFYWIYSFAQQEAPRREMTPEMQHLLEGMANVLRRQRDGLAATASSRN